MRLREIITGLPTSPTLAANQAAAARRARGESVLHMGFGQAPFPVHPRLEGALAAAAGANRYEPIEGIEALRSEALAYFAPRLGLAPEEYDLIVGPGSKLLLYALLMAIDGDTLLPVPSWVSYEPQIGMLGDRSIPVSTELSDAGYGIDPARLRATIHEARDAGRRPTKIILNSPNNPTGLTIAEADHRAIAQVCAEEEIVVISDEIYGLVAFDGPTRSIACAYPEGTVVTTGLSKHISLGGWRVGFAIVPRSLEGLHEALVSIASETWSSVASPIQHAARIAVSEDPEIESFIEECTRIHAGVARWVADRIRETPVLCPRPTGAFYLWPDFEPLREALQARGIETSTELAEALLTRHGLLTLPGVGFGAEPAQLALRLSVCDYDGAEALRVCRDLEDPANAISTFAPRVAQAAEALREFATG